MDVKLIEHEIEDYLISEKKKRDQQHNYLGFSHIGRCPRMLYDWLRDGHSDATRRAALNTESGMMFQRAALKMLIGAGRVDPVWLDMGDGDERRVIRSGWDARFYGHIDARANSGSLAEIKSFDRSGFENVRATDKIGFAYYAQAQTYLRYDDSSHLLFVAVSRDDRTMLDYHYLRARAIGADSRARRCRIGRRIRRAWCGMIWRGGSKRGRGGDDGRLRQILYRREASRDQAQRQEGVGAAAFLRSG